MKKTVSDKKEVIIHAPVLDVTQFPIVGTAALVSNRFSFEVIELLKHDMMNNTTKAAKKERRKTRDFDSEAKASLYQSPEGWYGMPANAFKSALVRAGQLCGVEMTLLKQCLYVIPDGEDAAETHVQLVRIYGEPEQFQVPTRTQNKVNISSASRFPAGWRATIRIQHEPAFISVSSVANLVARAGMNIGVGRGRPMSTSSVGMGWGTFQHATSEESRGATV